MIVLGIESTCDETAVAVVRDGTEILSNVVLSQIPLHRKFGGVFPELACRRHVDDLIPVLEEALTQANVTLSDIDLIAVAQGPGLIGALLLGFSTAKALSIALKKPYIGVNHVESHLYATAMTNGDQVRFPCIGVVVSGGHTALLHMEDFCHYTLIGQTVDDAIGEAFDKVAKMLGLPYPGGPEIEKLAKEGNPTTYPFRAGRVKENPLAFSFSGLKTAVLYTLQKGKSDKANIAASFQEAAFADVLKKTLLAAKKYPSHSILFGGGVAMNKHLKNIFQKSAPDQNCLWPSPALTTDNAAMIAGLGYHQYKASPAQMPLDAEPYTQWIAT